MGTARSIFEFLVDLQVDLLVDLNEFDTSRLAGIQRRIQNPVRHLLGKRFHKNYILDARQDPDFASDAGFNFSN